MAESRTGMGTTPRRCELFRLVLDHFALACHLEVVLYNKQQIGMQTSSVDFISWVLEDHFSTEIIDRGLYTRASSMGILVAHSILRALLKHGVVI